MQNTETGFNSTSTTTTPGQAVGGQGFDQLAVGLESAITDFQETGSPQAWTAILTAIKPITDFGMRFFGMTSTYVRRHPVQTTVAVVAIGLIVASLLKPASAPKVSGERNY